MTIEALNEKKPPKKNILVKSINEIIEPLNIVYKSLCSAKCEVIANGSVLDLLRRAHTFGINLARLDIRQESSRHSKLINSRKVKIIGFGKWKDYKFNEN